MRQMASITIYEGAAAETGGRTWTCRRTTAGEVCGAVSPARKRNCVVCGKPRPKRARPAHMAALDLPWEHYRDLNGGPDCGICGREPKPGKRHARDHDHQTGKPRGLLCFQCNRLLGNKSEAWLASALAYLRNRDTARIVPGVPVPDERESPVTDDEKVPALVDRAAAARLLGVSGPNLRKVVGLAPPLQERGIEGMDVKASTLWTRAEVEKLRDERAARR